ncbi:MAG: type I-B CRISPR-associated endonuclease Cas1b [Thermoproteota archaeon]
MRRNYYLLSPGKLKRKKNTVYYIKKTGDLEKVPLPIKKIDAIHAFGSVELNKKLLTFFSQERIPIHFYNYYGYYVGSYYPREYLHSGFLIVKQVKHYLDEDLRLEIAKEFVLGAMHNIRKNLEYYQRKGKDLADSLSEIKDQEKKVVSVHTIQELMGREGNIRRIYYPSFGKFLREPFKLSKRVYRPPDNMMNCLISFGNSLLYNSVLTEIYRTQLNPTISYLHEPGDRRFSLSLDISEVFKPVIVDRLIFNLINKRKINKTHFKKEMNFCHLTEKGKKTFIREWDKRLRVTVKHRRFKRHVSYKKLLRIECYKLVRHLSGGSPYQGFRRWW